MWAGAEDVAQESKRKRFLNYGNITFQIDCNRPIWIFSKKKSNPFTVSSDDANDGRQHENMCIICGTCFTFVFNTDIRRHLCRVNMGGPNWRQPCSISYNHNQRIAVRCNALTFLIILVAFLGVPTQSVDTKVVKNAWEKSLFVCLQTETLNTCSCCCTHMQK